MAKKNKQDDEVLIDVTQSISKVEKFFEDNGKALSAAAIGLFVVVGGYIAFLKFYQEPRELDAQNEIYHAQQLFEADSLKQAVEGFAGKAGFLTVAADYSGTKAGEMANYYAGISYLRLGEYENAIRLLDDFSTNDPILGVIAEGSIGDAFLELDQKEEAMDYYKKATSFNSNDFVVPFYLLKAGMLAETMDKNEDALDFYQTIKGDFPDARQAADIDRYIARVNAKI
ncbi:MAG: tetratricopeptide (TPR) repeat protein [Roseivirga sp.]|jgi:tetratricopeptide (TPR) repeat protein